MTSRTAPIAFVAVMWTASAALAQPQPAIPGRCRPSLRSRFLCTRSDSALSPGRSRLRTPRSIVLRPGLPADVVLLSGKYDAIRSFREAWKRDPACAMCYWGEAWAWGSNLNQVLAAADAPFAYAAVQKPIVLKDGNAGGTSVIEALARRYVEEFDPAKRPEQDHAYARAMETVYESVSRRSGHRYAVRRCAVSPRTASGASPRTTAAAPEPRFSERQANSRGARTLARARSASSRRLPLVRARDGGDREGRRRAALRGVPGHDIPGASHINHMPSHTFNEVGRWGDSVRANIEAWHSDLKAAAGEGFAIYPSHNLHMLVYAAAMDGQGPSQCGPARTTRSSHAATRCSRC